MKKLGFYFLSVFQTRNRCQPTHQTAISAFAVTTFSVALAVTHFFLYQRISLHVRVNVFFFFLNIRSLKIGVSVASCLDFHPNLRTSRFTYFCIKLTISVSIGGMAPNRHERSIFTNFEFGGRASFCNLFKTIIINIDVNVVKLDCKIRVTANAIEKDNKYVVVVYIVPVLFFTFLLSFWIYQCQVLLNILIQLSYKCFVFNQGFERIRLRISWVKKVRNEEVFRRMNV